MRSALVRARMHTLSAPALFDRQLQLQLEQQLQLQLQLQQQFELKLELQLQLQQLQFEQLQLELQQLEFLLLRLIASSAFAGFTQSTKATKEAAAVIGGGLLSQRSRGRSDAVALPQGLHRGCGGFDRRRPLPGPLRGGSLPLADDRLRTLA